MLGACEGVRPLSGLDALDASARAKLDAALSPWSGPLTWEMEGAEPATTTLTLSAAVRDGAVEEVGQGGCLRYRVPLDLTLRTADGRLDTTLAAEIELQGEGAAIVRGRAALDRVEGSLDPEAWLGPMPDGTLYTELDREGARSAGQIFIDAGDSADEVRVASW
jgi:hypothetical protein